MSIDVLLKENPESAYWIGFLAADGSFINDKRLQIALANKDSNHLIAFAEYISLGRDLLYNNRTNSVGLSKQDPVKIPHIMQRFEFNKQKTYNPPINLPYKEQDLLVSYLIGFIDGDGTITYQSGRKSVTLRTVSHISWYAFLSKLSDATLFGRITIRNDGYVQLASHRHEEIVKLKAKGVSLNIPMIDRKWNRVDEGLFIRGGMKEEIIDMISSGAPNKEIFLKTKCSPAYLSILRKKVGDLGDDILYE